VSGRDYGGYGGRHPTPTPGPRTTHTANTDFNGDGCTNRADMEILLTAYFNHTTDLKFDLNGDGKVNYQDIFVEMDTMNKGCRTSRTHHWWDFFRRDN
jgi:hypothetical protein